MAFVSTGWEMTVTMVDVGLNKTTKKYELQATDATEAAAAGAAVLTALAGVTDLEIIGYYWYEKFDEDAIVTPAIQKENQALLVFQIKDNPTKSATHSIPGAKNAIYVAASGKNNNIVKIDYAAVAAYAALFFAGGSAYLSDGELVEQLVSGHRRHMGNSRG